MSRTQIFSSVAVGLPSKVSGCEAEEEWQEVDWVTWSTGDVSVDTESFLLVFKPADGGGSFKSKPLGNLLGASPTSVPQDEDSRLTLVVTTSDALHRLYRFTFSSSQSAGEFAKLAVSAQSAEARKAAHSPQEANASAASAARLGQLATAIEENLEGRWPLLYVGVELYGPDPGSSSAGSASNAGSDSEVLLGRGVFVLLDPAEDQSGRVGSYDFLFYGEDEGASEPAKRVTISPGMTLKRLQANQEDGPAVTLQLRNPSVPSLPVYSLAFDAANTAGAFMRDFRVRQRVMELASKTVKRQRAANEARGELHEFKRSTFCARLFQFFLLIAVLAVVAMVTRFGILWRSNPGQPVGKHIEVVLKDFFNIGRLLQGVALTAASKACEVVESRRAMGAL